MAKDALLVSYLSLSPARDTSPLVEKILVDLTQGAEDLSPDDSNELAECLIGDLAESTQQGIRNLQISLLRILSRNPACTALAQLSTLDTLLKWSAFSVDPLDSTKRTESIEARKALCNIMVQHPLARDSLVISSHLNPFLQHLTTFASVSETELTTSHDSMDHFLTLRLLFFLTLQDSPVTRNLASDTRLVPLIRHAISMDVPEMEGKEALMVLYNLQRLVPDTSNPFTPLVPRLVDLIINTPPATLASPEPSGGIHAVHSLIHPMDTEAWPDMPKLIRLCDRLIEALDLLLQAFDTTTATTPLRPRIDERITPITLLLTRLVDAWPTLRTHVSSSLLPPRRDLSIAPEVGESLDSRLIRLLTAVGTEVRSHTVADLLYSLCHQDAKRFTERIGFGNAAGHLTRLGLDPKDALPTASSSSSSSSPHPPPTTSSAPSPLGIDPITGKTQSMSDIPSTDDWTEEEKEREAERLFVLFERLKATGVVQVENPVSRIHEISDEEDK
ncbi:guanine nucleotide exchange factor [Piptocephalis cylindrospora]|uniref:Guanine nucleotide exchange factor n=1 Tax=Piptocephalis cylindrospora TaxID=1907219 RepID=A0A4P9Y710_9FUNG|nr:guanine nucleotide exchange factor [Piptocephalis cylindrospora]|eukprot:RKP14887.1 guanine nucleotide exchange factor [Piptocephalis cylindrospora]